MDEGLLVNGFFLLVNGLFLLANGLFLLEGWGGMRSGF